MTKLWHFPPAHLAKADRLLSPHPPCSPEAGGVRAGPQPQQGSSFQARTGCDQQQFAEPLAVPLPSVPTACHARLAQPPTTALPTPFTETRVSAETGAEVPSTVGFVAASACHSKEGHCGDTAGPLSSTASERHPALPSPTVRRCWS